MLGCSRFFFKLDVLFIKLKEMPITLENFSFAINHLSVNVSLFWNYAWLILSISSITYGSFLIWCKKSN